jgi:hypothetical protein
LILLLRRLLFAAYFFEVGLLLAIIPWSSFWEHNAVLEAVSSVHTWTRSAYVRGAVSGLGIVNLMAGVGELLSAWRYRDEGAAVAPATSVNGSGG